MNLSRRLGGQRAQGGGNRLGEQVRPVQRGSGVQSTEHPATVPSPPPSRDEHPGPRR
jgi:hypothetical protein